MPANLHTGLPRTDPRFPHWSPMLGAVAIPYVDAAEVGGEMRTGGSTVTPEQDLQSREPVPEMVMGIATSSLSGALIGGVAAGSWRGAAIGTGLSAACWSAFTLVNAWRHLGNVSKAVLATASVLGLGTVATLVVLRRASK